MSEGTRNADSSNPPPAERTGLAETINFMVARKIDSLLWLTRSGTVIFTFLSIIPLFSTNPYTSYQRALLSNAATSALRLHQRMPRVQFTREFGALLMLEDSCHYLLYSILFIYSYPVTLSLLPISLFAVLHSSHYGITILNKLGGMFSTNIEQGLYFCIVRRQQTILRFVALTEVSLMPFTIFLALSGKGSILIPFAYCRFLTLRYGSRRNPYTRTVFHEMRIILENFGNTTQFPWLKDACFKIINFASWLAPPMATQH